MTPDTPPPDYGEPWETSGNADAEEWIAATNWTNDAGDIICSPPVDAEISVGHWKARSERIIACVNALAGVQDPAAHLANLNATIEQQAETLQSAIELIRRVSTGPATPNDAWQWLKQRGLDKYQHVNPDRKSHDQRA